MFDKLIHGAEAHRAYFYRLGTAVAALIASYGFIDGKLEVALVSLLGTLLGGTASANTSTKSGDV